MKFILASSSVTRKNLLERARIPADYVRPNIDEDLILAGLKSEGAKPRDCVDTLAEYKARKISHKYPGAFVLGTDQMVEIDGDIYGKPKSKSELLDRFEKYTTAPHRLWTGNVIYQNGEPVWRYVGKSVLKVKNLTKTEIQDYIDQNWDDIRHSCAGYFFEETPHLFSNVSGTYPEILGLSLFQVTAFLKTQGVLGPDHPDFKMAAVLGNPIQQSKSPLIHKRWMDLADLAGDYIPIDVPHGTFDQVIRNLADLGFSGVNVTIPHKISALETADTLNAAATSIGASNTLVFQGGSVAGMNTDAYGFITNLKQGAPNWQPQGTSALVLGAGGASRAVVFALVQEGLSKIYLSNRNKDRADDLAAEFPEHVQVIGWDDRSAKVADVDLIVNTTSLGMVGSPELDIDLSGLRSSTVVTDLVYKPLETKLLEIAGGKGCICVDGLGMLLHQAAPAFEAWFGVKPDVTDELRKIVLS